MVSTRIFRVCLYLVNLSWKEFQVLKGQELTKLAQSGFMTLYGHLLNVCEYCCGYFWEARAKTGLLQNYWGTYPWRERGESWRRQRGPSAFDVGLICESDGGGRKMGWEECQITVRFQENWSQSDGKSLCQSHPSLRLQQRSCVNRSQLCPAMGMSWQVRMSNSWHRQAIMLPTAGDLSILMAAIACMVEDYFSLDWDKSPSRGTVSALINTVTFGK